MIAFFLVMIGYSMNPYKGAHYFVNPHFQVEIDASIKLHPNMEAEFMAVRNVSAAIWLDSMAVMEANLTNYLEAANALAKSSPVLIQFIVYDLPNRDCHALASNGELHCADSSCAVALETYRTKYIDRIVSKIQAYPNPNLRIVLIIEPDSLPNLATNMGTPKCAQSETAYKTGVTYAIKSLAALSNTYLYVDAAHGGWLGWTNNMGKAFTVWNDVITAAGGWKLIRGFATNTANYQPLGTTADKDIDPCNLKSQYNFATTEALYVQLLSTTLKNQGVDDMYFIIDTGRNGNVNCRIGTTQCSMWCNPVGAGIGRRPEPSPVDLEDLPIDALAWLKTPGESDGTSDSSAPRYDSTCGSSNAFKPSPQAGQWNDAQFVQLCKNANPPLTGTTIPPSPPHTTQTTTPHPGPGTCSGAYGQCGGKNWPGPFCCQGECTCVKQGDYYSQCHPPNGKNTCGSFDDE